MPYKLPHAPQLSDLMRTPTDRRAEDWPAGSFRHQRMPTVHCRAKLRPIGGGRLKSLPSSSTFPEWDSIQPGESSQMI
jgi:hypothetical protein